MNLAQILLPFKFVSNIDDQHKNTINLDICLYLYWKKKCIQSIFDTNSNKIVVLSKKGSLGYKNF